MALRRWPDVAGPNASNGADGGLTARRLLVAKEGLTPPM
jgi:hypothetical protein